MRITSTFGAQMNFWLFSLVGRILNGEPLRKAGPADYRFFFAILMLLPVEIAAFAFNPVGKNIMDHGSVVAIWAYNCIAIIVSLAVLIPCAKWVPPAVSLSLAICIWVAAFWIAWHWH